MTSFWDQFSKRYDSIHDAFRTPAWFRPDAGVSAIPDAHQVDDDLWMIEDGLFVTGRTRVWDQSRNEYRVDSEPKVGLLFLAQTVDAIAWHRQTVAERPDLQPLTSCSIAASVPTYGELCARFQCSESARYHGKLGYFIDKKVFVDPVAFCFQSLSDTDAELPYLIRIQARVGEKRHTQPGATDNPEDAQRLREDH